MKEATQALEFQSQCTIIIDLAIEADHPATGHIRHGLTTACARVDDGETPMSQHNPIVLG